MLKKIVMFNFLILITTQFVLTNDDVENIRVKKNPDPIYLDSDYIEDSGVRIKEPDLIYIKDSVYVLEKNVVVTSPIIYSGICTINGNNYTLKLGQKIIVDNNSTLILKNLTMIDVDYSISLLDKSSKIIFENVVWEINDFFDFSDGCFEILEGYFKIMGNNYVTFLYSTSQESIIKSNADFILNNIYFFYCPDSQKDDLIFMQNKEAKLTLINSKLIMPTSDLSLTKGTMIIDGKENSIMSFGENALNFGNGKKEIDNLSINLLSKSGIRVDKGVLDYNNIA